MRPRAIAPVVAGALLALTAAATGCYRPDLRSCRLTCSTGTCPGGLDCNPAGYCVEPGFGGDCQSLLGDGGPGLADAGPDAGPPQPASVTLTTLVNGNEGQLAFAAYQDGDGPWLAPSWNGSGYQFQSDTGRYGVITVCLYQDRKGSTARTRYLYATTNDATALVETCDDQVGASSLDVTVEGLGPTDCASVTTRWGGGAQVCGGTGGSTGTISALPPGSTDVLLARHPGDPLSPIDSIAVYRGQAIDAGGNAFVGDFTNGVAPSSASYAIGGNDPGLSFIFQSSFVTGGGTTIGITNSTATSGSYSSIDGPQADDMTELIAAQTTGSSDELEAIIAFVHTPATFDATLPAALASGTADVAATSPYPLLHASASRQTGAGLYSAHFDEHSADGTSGVAVDLVTTSGWLAGAALDWTAPDLSTVAGWDSQWDPTTALDMEWYVTAEIATLPVEDLLDLDFTVPKAAWDGRVLEIAERSGTIAATP